MALLGPQNQQLDRLGRELKCPICLSLFEHASSLSCNHTFCKSCILQSMKTKSSCPICKLPTTRREVKAAPQMDNLVAIYISMNNSIGLDLMASQAAPVSMEPVQTSSVKGSISKSRKALSNISNHEQPSQLHQMKTPNYTFTGALPAKKRIQVPQPSSLGGEIVKDNNLSSQSDFINQRMVTNGIGCPTTKRKNKHLKKKKRSADNTATNHSYCSNTYKRAKRFESLAVRPCSTQLDASMKIDCGAETSHLDCKKVRGSEDKDARQFPGNSPAANAENHNFKSTIDLPATECITRRELDSFFWLRDVSSQETGAVQITQLTMTQSAAKLPTFSDLKDSDDNQDIDVNEEVMKNAVICEPGSYDSDDFEWTQHPCSPELNCSPSKLQVSTDIVVNLPLETSHLANEGPSINIPQRHLQDLSFTKSPTNKRASIVAAKAQENLDSAATRSKRTPKCHRRKATLKQIKINSLPEADAMLQSSGHTKDLTDVTIEPAGRTIRHKRAKEIGLHSENSTAKSASFGDLERERDPPKEFTKSRRVTVPSQFSCVFCGTASCSKVTGPMMHYDQNGAPLGGLDFHGKVFHVHKCCAEWAPDVYFEDDVAKNLAVEVARGLKIKCSSCGKRGAALGCCIKRCRKSYHYRCARALPCAWEQECFIMLCPEHKAENFPVKKCRRRVLASKRVEDESRQTKAIAMGPVRVDADEEKFGKWAYGQSSKWVLSGSALDKAGKDQLATFAMITGATVSKAWNASITHVIAGTDELGAARRTMKFLLAILEGKWILNAKWLSACLKAGQPVDEEPYEISIDIHGAIGGPKAGRVLAAKKAPKLFEKLQFYFMPDFLTSYKGDLQALVVAGGGVVLHRKPVCLIADGDGDTNQQRHTIVVYNNEMPTMSTDKKSDMKKRRQEEAILLAIHASASAVPHNWILNSIGSSTCDYTRRAVPAES